MWAFHTVYNGKHETDVPQAGRDSYGDRYEPGWL